MKLRAWIFLLVGAAGCGWSNSMYLARQASRDARDYESKGRPFDAQSAWGRVLTKAESAYARSGGTRMEALAYRGIAQARLGNCVAGVPDLERALFQPGIHSWVDPAHYELGRCQQQLGLPGAEDQLQGLLSSADDQRRLEVARVLSDVYLDAARWQDILALLPEVDDPHLRFARAVAQAGTGHAAEARTEVAPLIAERDTTVAWPRLIEVLAAAGSEWTDALIDTLTQFPKVTQLQRAPWLASATRGALTRGDTAVAAQRLARLEATGASVYLSEGQRAMLEYRVSRAATIDGLEHAIAGAPAPGPADGGPNTRMRTVLRTAGQILSERDSLSGTPQGDLRLFAGADDAVSILQAPLLGRTLLQQIERDWPRSPYVVKSLLARILNEPDSAEALRARLFSFPPSPYTAFLQLREDPGYAVLEDSLGAFITSRAVAAFNRGNVVNELFQQ